MAKLNHAEFCNEGCLCTRCTRDNYDEEREDPSVAACCDRTQGTAREGDLYCCITSCPFFEAEE